MSAVPRASQILLVGQKIRQIRKSRHLTQADLAARIGVTQSDLSRMENGEYKVGLDTLFRILQVFELSMSHFFEEPAADAEPPTLRETLAERPRRSRTGPRSPRIPAARSREFIAFKKMQIEKARSDEDPGDDTNG